MLLLKIDFVNMFYCKPRKLHTTNKGLILNNSMTGSYQFAKGFQVIYTIISVFS